jgi:hypothetical protein
MKVTMTETEALTMTPEQVNLRALKKAWDELNRAESDMARMRSFPKMSLGMKADFSTASHIATEARRAIDSILGGVR